MSSPAPLNGRYQLIAERGRGGMAVIWEAHDDALDRRVAVKLLHPQFARDPEFLERFRREARAAAGLSHPNVVGIYDAGEDQASGSPFLVMELVDGESLKDRIRRTGPMSEAQVRAIGGAVAEALEYAHRRGFVHRDVKPQNILIGNDGRVRLADFGIAQALSASSLTRTGAVMGSVHYLAPELARGQASSPASDVYSLGAVLYEMATGRMPFEAETDMAVALAHVEQAPRAPRQVNPSISPALEHIILQALAKNPAARFASAAALADSLRAPEAGQRTERIATVPPPPPARRVMPVSAAANSAPPPVRRRNAPPSRGGGGPGNGIVIVLLVLAAVLLALGAGFFGLANIFRPGGASPTPSPTSQAGASASPAGVATKPPVVVAPTDTPVPPTPTSVVSPEPSPTRTTPTATPAPTAPAATPTPARIPVPNVVGRAQDQAIAEIERAGLTATVRGVNANAERGTVVEQSPAVGEALPRGGTVSISVGSGQVVVPNVEGMREAEAIRRLTDAGLRIDSVRQREDREVPRGNVIRTDPEKARVVPRGTTVDVFVSSGG